MDRTADPSLMRLLAEAAAPSGRTETPFLELPEYEADGGCGNFTGFNSVNLQEIYVVRKQAAVRSQISPPGGQKPCLALLPNGDLLATQVANDNIALCRSKDSGFSWGPPREVVVPGGAQLPGRAPIFSALADGTLLLGHRTMHRSTDEGQTWQECQLDRSVTVAGETYEIGWGENDGPHQLSDGTVICSGYINLAPGRPKAYLLRSTDGGRSWRAGSYIADASEVNIAVLAQDTLFACLRVGTGEPPAGEGGVIVAVTESSDAGRTWTPPRRIGLGKAQSPGFPVRLKDGRLIIVYTHRQFPHGVQAIASGDGGQSWDIDSPIILAWSSWDAYCGHPRSLVLSDGSIVTGYYARMFRGPPVRTTGLLLRWRVPEDWPGKWPPSPAPLTAPAEKQPLLEVPKYAASGGSGAYTGFNSVNLQEIYCVRKEPAVRSQISPRPTTKPCLARLPDGDLLATQVANDNIALCRSRDSGFSWGPPREVVVPGKGTLPGRAPMFAALADGALLLGCESIYRSADEGQTWQECQLDRSVTVAGKTYEIGWGESDGPHQLSDGTVICSGYISLASGRPKAYLLRSNDGGRSWGDRSYIADASEVNLAVLPGDRLFACLRVGTGEPPAGEGGAIVEVTESSDAGRNWRRPRRIGLGTAQIPGFPLYLNDGRLLLIYGNRQFPFGAQVIASRDGGQTWDSEHAIILAWFSWDNYCGHPRSVLLPDGSIVTGYYARVFTGTHGIVFTPTERDPNPDVVGHCVRWRVPDSWPPVRHGSPPKTPRNPGRNWPTPASKRPGT